MKRLERLELVDKLGRELQGRMSYADIDQYMAAFGVDTSKETSNINSKWVYVKELLADESDNLVLRIADELDVDHGYTIAGTELVPESKFWRPGHFRLFLSHLSSFKVQTARLQECLYQYGISSFVAHKDIEPTREWLEEIEKALHSMDALAAILTPGFGESLWTDQEVGFALGKNTLVIPIRKGMNPYGFLGKFQAMQGDRKTIGQVAEELFSIVANSKSTRQPMASAIVDQVLSASSVKLARNRLGLFDEMHSIPKTELERLRENIPSYDALFKSKSFLNEANNLLSNNGINRVEAEQEKTGDWDDDIPF